ncbi:MAG: hypothetical protein AB8G77_08725 [Rhodothermales bacterium]
MKLNSLLYLPSIFVQINNEYSLSRYVCLFMLVTLLTTTFVQSPVLAQTTYSFGGRTFIDYSYIATSPDSGKAGDNGYSFRQIQFGTDAKLSDTFSARLRFEVSNSSTTAQGQAAPYVKDLLLKWHNILGEGHNLIIGLTHPPSFVVSQKAWGYRSLARTLTAKNRILSSRDFGVVIRGPLAKNGSLRYGLMVGSNEGVRREDDNNKRFYSQIEWYPSSTISATIGLDYANYSDDRTAGLHIPLFVGYKGSRFSAGLEAFTYNLQYDGATPDQTQSGASIYGILPVNDIASFIVRFDYVNMDLDTISYSHTYTVIGVSLQPHKNVRFIPNVEIAKDQRDREPLINARITLHVDFK